ncbi:MAG: knotted carbamoyltransferase YgeW [Bradymonadales bacterium]|nr:knotted carbamoyltransferase YgeW [Bradymonadales bacterium]
MAMDLKDHPNLGALFQQQLAELGKLSPRMAGDDFLLTWERSEEDIKATLLVADLLQTLRLTNRSARVFDSGIAISNFRDLSTRTRFSFEAAANLLGLETMAIDESKIQVAHGETLRETAAMLGFLTDAVGIRDDLFVGYSHKYIVDYAAALTQAVEERTLDRKPVVVNLQSDVDHPTQSMSDLLHLKHYYGSLEALRGKKIAMTWAHSPSYGKPLSVAQGVIGLLTRFGMEVVLAHPEGYQLLDGVTEVARANAEASGGRFAIVDSMAEAFEGADIVYPKSWAPMNILEERSALLAAGNKDAGAQKDLEKRCLQQNAQFESWECTAALMARTKGGEGLYMHCLPADITGVSCPAGEVTDEVFSKYRRETYFEARQKPYIVAAMIFLGTFPQAAQLLDELWRKGSARMAGSF